MIGCGYACRRTILLLLREDKCSLYFFFHCLVYEFSNVYTYKVVLPLLLPYIHHNSSCTYEHVHICICTYMHMYIYAYIHSMMHLLIHSCMHACMHTHTHTYRTCTDSCACRCASSSPNIPNSNASQPGAYLVSLSHLYVSTCVTEKFI